MVCTRHTHTHNVTLDSGYIIYYEHERSPYGLHIKKTGHNPSRELSAGWWMLTSANAVTY
jgi:hypothetical protein